MTGSQKGKTTSDETRELALRARGGDRQAAYQILGEQAATETWVAAIDALAREPGDVDLELVAHRTLRRPPVEVLAAVLRLARAAGTPRAGYVAHAIATLRSEERVTAEARQLCDELTQGRALELLADDRATDALYAVLSRRLDEQASLLLEIEHDQAREELLDALRTEYERLQELARDSRWRSGSYRHLLRHALADLALIAQAGGRLEDQAYRLLQQRTDEPETNRELLALLPQETRKAYLAWVVARPSGKEETARALFALDEIDSRYPEDVDTASIARLLESKDSEIAIAAVGVVMQRTPESASNDRALADLIARASPIEQASIVGEIARDVPSRIRIDLWSSEVDRFVAEVRTADVTSELARTFSRAIDPDVRLRALALLKGRVDKHDCATEVAIAALSRTSEPDAPEILTLLDDPEFRAGFWLALRTADDVPTRLLEALVERETPEVAADHLVVLHTGRTPEIASAIEDLALSGVEAGSIAADSLQDSDLGAALTSRGRDRLTTLGRSLERLQDLISHGDRAAEVELSREVGDIVARAIERSTGNERLTDDYRRLAGATDQTERPEDSEPSLALNVAEIESATTALAKAGVQITVEGDALAADIDQDVNDLTKLRALAIAEQRSDRASEETRATACRIRDAVATALATTGFSQRAMSDLVGSGPLAAAVMGLPPTARTALFDATRDAGFEPPRAWLVHPVVGQWMSSRDATSGPGAAGSEATDQLVLLQDVATAVRDSEARLAASREAARRGFVAASEPVLADLDQTFDAYVQVWLGLERLGIRRVAAVGEVLSVERLDPARHEVVGNARGERYIVRFAGITVGDEVIRRARVEVYG